MAADLEQRREMLAAKLAAEEAQLQRELLDQQVTSSCLSESFETTSVLSMLEMDLLEHLESARLHRVQD